MAPRTQVNSATGLMGVTGAGKSALLATLAKYVYKRWGKITRYYNSDGGGFPASIQECQALGIMEVFRMRTRDPGDLNLSFETAYRSCQGWWPRKIKPSTGEVPPGVEMVPPVAIRFALTCAQGHLLKTVPSESLILPTPCAQCNHQIYTKQNMQVARTIAVNDGFEHVGAVCFDGLSSMLSWEMMELGHRAGRMELKGEEAAIGGKVKSGDLNFGGVTRSHVGFAQTRGEELVHLSLGIPNLVVPPIFTMLTHEDVDDRSLSITGPKIAGRAKTDEAPQWFGNMLEAAKIPNPQGNGECYTLYLSEFTRDGRRHLCKNRAAPGTMPPVLMDPPDTDKPENAPAAFSQFNLGLFFEMLDQALDRGIERAKLEFPGAPGVKDEWVEIGGQSMVIEVPHVQPGQLAPAARPLQTLAPAPLPTAAPPVQAAPPVAAPAPKGRKKAQAAGTVPPVATPALPPVPAAPAPLPAAALPVAMPQPVPVVASPGVVAHPAAPAPMPAGAAPVSAPAPIPAAGAPPTAAPPQAALAPPPGRRPLAQAAPAPRQGAPGVSVSGPATTPRPTAAAPRPPAAAPRPPAPPAAQ